MAYVDISRETLAAIGEKIKSSSPYIFSNYDFAVGHLLVYLTKDDTQLEAARGLFIFVIEKWMINLMPIIESQNIQLNDLKSDQRLVHLTAFYHYMTSHYDRDAIPEFWWVIKDYKNDIEKVLRQFIVNDFYFKNFKSAVGTLEVLREFINTLPERYLKETKDPNNVDRQLMVRFIRVVHQNCLNHKSEIQIRLGLLLFIVMHIAEQYKGYKGLISPTRSALYRLCIAFLKVEHHSKLTLENRRELLEKLSGLFAHFHLSDEFTELSHELEKFRYELDPDNLDESCRDVREYKSFKNATSFSVMLVGLGQALLWTGGVAGIAVPAAYMTLYIYSHDDSQVGAKLYDLMTLSDDLLSKITLGLYSHLFSEIYTATFGVSVIEIAKPEEGYEKLYSFVPDEDKKRTDDWINALLSLPVPNVITEEERKCICTVSGRSPNTALEILPEPESVDDGYLLVPTPPSSSLLKRC